MLKVLTLLLLKTTPKSYYEGVIPAYFADCDRENKRYLLKEASLYTVGGWEYRIETIVYSVKLRLLRLERKLNNWLDNK